MPRWSHIDTDGLPEKYDCANLIEEGKSREEIIQWMNARIKDGPTPSHVSVVEGNPEAKPAKKKEVTKKKSVEPEPEPQGNVTPLRQPDIEEIVGLPPEFSEDALAERFTEKYADTLMYVGPWDRWVHWNGEIWERDESFLAFNNARQIARSAAAEVSERLDLGDKRNKMATAISTRRTMSNIESIARTDRRHVASPKQFDSDPWMLNTPDGIVDLRTGEMRPARRDDFVSKMTAVGPNNKKPDIWMKYLKDATNGDEELEGYLKRVAGYCLTGSIAEHAFFFCYGTGQNGKGIYKDMLDWMLHTYSRAANIDTFTDQRFTKHSSELAYFQGSRLVTSTEPPEGAKWAEGRIKAMTGGDPITANYMHKDPFTFAPLFKLLFTGNFRPSLRTVDKAIKRRLYLIPFEYEVPDSKKDYFLDKKIREPEVAGGILNWMIEGCMEWQDTMLKPPKRVIYATAEYLESEDRIGRFLEEHCDVGKHLRIQSALLFTKYKNWADVNNEYAVSNKRFKALLRQKGYIPEKLGGDQVIIGLGLKE